MLTLLTIIRSQSSCQMSADYISNAIHLNASAMGRKIYVRLPNKLDYCGIHTLAMMYALRLINSGRNFFTVIFVSFLLLKSISPKVSL